MSEEPRIVVNPRSVYHMRQEILRLVEQERAAHGGALAPAELERLASGWTKKYRTLRPETACLLVERMADDAAPEPGRFALFVLAGLERRYSDELWPRIVALHAALASPDLRLMLARRVAAPLLERRPGVLEALDGAKDPPPAAETLLLAETARALQVTAPDVVARVESILARD